MRISLFQRRLAFKKYIPYNNPYSSQSLSMSQNSIDNTESNTESRPIYTCMLQKLQAQFDPLELQIDDESPQHASHAAMKDYPISESHFSAFIVSNAFNNQTLVKRHRMVYQVLEEEFKKGLHALRLETLTPEEYQKKYTK